MEHELNEEWWEDDRGSYLRDLDRQIESLEESLNEGVDRGFGSKWDVHCINRQERLDTLRILYKERARARNIFGMG
tara:strand:+ start:1493 stop:1720 length:228 start_codon:yes stop_codon:yes gene_type:complete